MSELKERLLDRHLVFFDLVTTGLNPLRHEIIEIAAIAARPPHFRSFAEFKIKTLPQHIETADPEALEINQYSKKSWAQATVLKQGIKKSLSTVNYKGFLEHKFESPFLQCGKLCTRKKAGF